MTASLRQEPYFFVLEGQSLNTIIPFALHIQNAIVTLGGPTIRLFNASKSGFDLEGPTTADLADDFGTRVAPHLKIANKNMLIINGGQTGCSSGDSATTLRSEAAAHAALARAANPACKVLICTIPSASSSYYDSTANGHRNTYNAGLLSTGVSSGDFDGVADIAAALDAVANPDGTDPTYYSDLVHWKEAAGLAVAPTVAVKVITLFGI